MHIIDGIHEWMKEAVCPVFILFFAASTNLKHGHVRSVHGPVGKRRSAGSPVGQPGGIGARGH